MSKDVVALDSYKYDKETSSVEAVYSVNKSDWPNSSIKKSLTLSINKDHDWTAGIRLDVLIPQETPEKAVIMLADWLDRLSAAIKLGDRALDKISDAIKCGEYTLPKLDEEQVNEQR